ncbi:MAG: tetratricopeptide repeat protein [Nitrospinae bacterium]|nr:tetratricopeptide repeat protein [Nitrospinota bacterium]
MRFLKSSLLAIFAFSTLAIVAPAFADSFEEPEENVNVPMSTPTGLPPAARDHNNAGLEAWKNGNKAEAKSHFADAVKAAPNSADLHYNLGLAYHVAGDHAKATEEFKLAYSNAGDNRLIKSAKLTKQHLKK